MKIKVGLTVSFMLCILCSIVSTSEATVYTVYTDYASFSAAAGATSLYDFESDSVGYISSPSYSGGHSGDVRDFGDFSIDSTSTGIYESMVRELSGNKDIYVNTYNNAAALNVILDNDVRAFAFDYVVEGNQPYDHGTFSLLGTTWDLGANGASGFFGIVDDAGTIAAGTAFSFGQQTSNWSGLSFDNLMYSSSSNGSSPPVPEPATMMMLGLGLVGFAARRKK